MNSRKAITLSVYREGREIDRTVLSPSKSGLTIGESPFNDVSVSIPGIPDRHRLAERGMFGNYILIPRDMDGSIDIGSGPISLKGIISLGLMKKKRDSYIFRMPHDASCRLKVGDFTLLFNFERIKKKKRGELEAVLPKRSWIAKDDRQFMLFLLVAATLNFSMAGYLRTVEIKKVEQVEALKNMPTRFARLILKPEMIKEKKAPAKQKPEEKEEKQKEEVKKEKEQPKEHQAEAHQASGSDSAAGGVRSKGLLGLVTSKARPDILSDSLFETGDGSAPSSPAGSASGKSRSADALAGLSVQGFEGVSIDSSVYSQGKKAKGVDDILKEKKDMSISARRDRQTKGGTEPNEDAASARKRSDEEVARTVLSYVGGVKYLYNNSLRKDPSLHGKITVKLVISAEGKVIKVEKVSSSLNAPELEEAIINRVYKWQFPEEKGVGDFIVTYTFDFSPTG